MESCFVLVDCTGKNYKNEMKLRANQVINSCAGDKVNGHKRHGYNKSPCDDIWFRREIEIFIHFLCTFFSY